MFRVLQDALIFIFLFFDSLTQKSTINWEFVTGFWNCNTVLWKWMNVQLSCILQSSHKRHCCCVFLCVFFWGGEEGADNLIAAMSRLFNTEPFFVCVLCLHKTICILGWFQKVANNCYLVGMFDYYCDASYKHF